MQACSPGVGRGPSTHPRAHSIRSVATSVSFQRNIAVSKILEAATWKSSNVFTSVYLRDVAFSSQEGVSLGPVVAAGSVLGVGALA